MRSILKNRVLVTIIAILLMANIAMLVFLISGMRKPEIAPVEKEKTDYSTVSFLQTKVGFDQNQVNQLKQLKEEHYLKINPLFEDMRKTKDQLFLLIKDSLSGERLDSLTTLIGDKQKNLDLQVFRMMREVRNLCTPQQLLKFDSSSKNCL